MARRSEAAADAIATLLALPVLAALVVGVFWLGGICFEYTVWCVFGKDLPFAADVLGGILTSESCVLTAAVCLFLRLCGVHFPLF